MNFMFEWREQYHTSERSKRVRYCSSATRTRERKIHMFFLLYKHTDDGVFDDFPKTTDHFPKIPENVRRCPKIAEDFRGRPEDVSMIH